jgi:hypothetical protein
MSAYSFNQVICMCEEFAEDARLDENEEEALVWDAAKAVMEKRKKQCEDSYKG